MSTAESTLQTDRPTAGETTAAADADGPRATVWSRLAGWWPIWVILALQVLFLWPILGTDYASDDTINSVFWGGVGYAHSDFWTEATKFVTGFWTSNGRFFPLSFYQGYGLFYVVHGLVAYKAIQLTLTVLASLSVAVLLRSLRLSIVRTALVLLVVTVAFELRLGQDPILAFTGLMQSVVIETALSLACFSRWLRTGGRWALAGSFVLFVMVCLTYESAYLFSAFHLAIALLVRGPRPLRQRLRRSDLRTWLRAALPSLPFLVLSVICLAGASYGRSQAGAGQNGPWAISYKAGAIARTFGEQVFAGLPLSYDFKAPGDQPFLPHRDLLAKMSFSSILVGLLIAALAAGLLVLDRRRRAAAADGDQLSTGAGVVGGLVVWIVAAAPIALAVRYQAELRWGLGHVPVFIEYYGIALLLTSIGLWLINRSWGSARASTIVAGALVVLVGGVGAITYQANVVMANFTKPGREARMLFERALDTGVADAVPDNAHILDAEIPDPWVFTAFYYQHTQRRFEIKPKTAPEWTAAAQHHPQACSADPADGTYWVSALAKAPDGPDYESFSCLGPPGVARDGLTTDRLFVRRTPDDKPFLITGDYAPKGNRTRSFEKLSTELHARSTDKAHEAIMALPITRRPLNPNTLVLTFDPNPLIAAWGDGCLVALGAPAGTCALHGSATLVNPGDTPLHDILSFTVMAIHKPGSTFTIAGQRIVLTKKPQVVTVTVDVPPRSTRKLPTTGPATGTFLGGIGVRSS